MNLYDAIHNPRTESNVREMKSKTPIQDRIRRNQTLKDENIIAADFYHLKKVEKMNQIKMPKPKKNWYEKIKDFFRKK